MLVVGVVGFLKVKMEKLELITINLKILLWKTRKTGQLLIEKSCILYFYLLYKEPVSLPESAVPLSIGTLR